VGDLAGGQPIAEPEPLGGGGAERADSGFQRPVGGGEDAADHDHTFMDIDAGAARK